MRSCLTPHCSVMLTKCIISCLDPWYIATYGSAFASLFSVDYLVHSIPCCYSSHPFYLPSPPWVITSSASCQLTQPQSIVPRGVGLASTAQFFYTCLLRRHGNNVVYRSQGPNNSSLWKWHLLACLLTYLITSWRWVLLEKLTGSQSRNSEQFMEPESSLPRLQGPVPCPLNMI
jgi:hypothetical protein